MTIHIDPARINITPRLPLRHDTLTEAVLDAEADAWTDDDGARLPHPADWREIVRIATTSGPVSLTGGKADV